MIADLFAGLPRRLPSELFTTLFDASGVRIERIVGIYSDPGGGRRRRQPLTGMANYERDPLLGSEQNARGLLTWLGGAGGAL